MGPASFTMKKLGHTLMTIELRFLRGILHKTTVSNNETGY